MIIDFANLNLHERPTLILKNAGGTPLGVIGYATNIELEGNYNEISVLTFNVPAKVDGTDIPYYDDIVGMRVIEIPNIGQFTLVSPEEHNDGVYKSKKCKSYSLEYEFSYKKITMAKDTYKFWGDAFSDQSNTVLGMIMELMPSWTVASVSASLLNKYRTFEINNENLYNFIKNTLQQSFGCIFDFNTLNRSVTVRDVTLDATEQPVYLSTQNLVKEITIHEDVENMVTRLDVNGADGVDIRDVNPTGTNKIINLDYYMNTKNFDQALITKYYAWKQLVSNHRDAYYANSINYTLAVMKLETSRSHLVDLEGELINLDNQRGVIIQAISRGIATQSDLDALNVQFNAKAAQVETAESEIEDLEEAQEAALEVLKNIVTQCSFENYFTAAERAELDRYIRDGDITESSFVSTTSVFSDDGVGANLNGVSFSVTGAEIERIVQGSNTIYDFKGGKLYVGNDVEANVISGVLNYSSSSGVIFTASLSSGTINEDDIISGSVTINAPTASVTSYSSSEISISNLSGYMYFSLNPSEYQRRSVAWNLYEYGELMAEKLSQPTYTFSIESANFLALEDFEAFKNHMKLGSKIYLDKGDETLRPICIGVQCGFDDLSRLTLKFGDSYVRSDTSFKLVDILEKSVSMGRTVDAGKFNYEEFSETGVRTSVRKFMTDAIDVSKNKILSSKDQAISWDTAGLRLRKWANQTQTAYEDEQIWMNNNSVLMTDDNWQTAKMAIGKILKPGSNPQAGEYLWGLIAEMVVGRIIAGESLIIESAKTNGQGVSVFRVDENGCRIENGDLSLIGAQKSTRKYVTIRATSMYSKCDTTSEVVETLAIGTQVTVLDDIIDPESTTSGLLYCVNSNGKRGWVSSIDMRHVSSTVGQRHVVIHPDVGIVIGKYPVVEKDSSDHYKIIEENAKMWIDALGNVYMSGAINATSLQIKGTSVPDDIGDRVTNVELKTTDNAIISTVTESASGQAAIGSMIEQKADLIRLQAEKIAWESDYSEMEEDGTLTVKRAIIDGPLSAVKKEGSVRNGMVIGKDQIICIRNGNNVFNILMPGAGSISYIDDSGTPISGLAPSVPEYGDFDLDNPPPPINPTGNNGVSVSATGSTYALMLGAGGQIQAMLEPDGKLWLCPDRIYIWPKDGLYSHNSKGSTNTINIGKGAISVKDGIVTGLTNPQGLSRNIPFLVDVYFTESGIEPVFNTLVVENGIITNVLDGWIP